MWLAERSVEGYSMSKKIITLIIATIHIFSAGNLYADTTLIDAIAHTKTAIEQGKLRYDAKFLTHAKLALKAATVNYRNMTASFSWVEADANAHKYANLKSGINELKEAIGDEKNFHVTEAVIHAEKALQFFQSTPE